MQQSKTLRKHIEDGNFDSLGQIMREAWEIKKSLVSEISNDSIDEMFQKAINAGAIGGKICGAGGGGFLLLYVPRDKQNSVRTALKGYRELPFMLDKYGTRIVFNQMADYWR